MRPNLDAGPHRRKYGWLPQPPDVRDERWAIREVPVAVLPPAADLTPYLPPVLDQGELGSCGPNAVMGMVGLEARQEGRQLGPESRLFAYWNCRWLMGTVWEDSGVDNRSLLKALANWGYCGEALCPYDVRAFARRPPGLAYIQARPNRIKVYNAVEQNLDVMRGVLAAGHPVLFGFSVYESFEGADVAKTGVVPLPSSSEQLLGGHDVYLYGYDDSREAFRFRNSWGADWGEGGNGWMPYAYAENPNLSGDFWTFNAVPLSRSA